MKCALIVAMVLFISMLVLEVQAQPIVDSDMIEISLDGGTFIDASPYVSDIVISIGVIDDKHVKHTKRDDINHWNAQLGTPVTEYKADFMIHTDQITADVDSYRIRLAFKIETTLGSGLFNSSPISEPSDPVGFIGKPGRAKNQG